MSRKIALALFSIVVLSVAVFILYQYRTVESKNTEIKTQITAVEAEVKAPPPPPRIIEKTIRIERKAMTEDGKPANLPPIEHKIKEIDDSPIKEYEKNQQIKIELIGILKLQINENNSWETIAKLLVLILISYGGIKYINKRFA